MKIQMLFLILIVLSGACVPASPSSFIPLEIQSACFNFEDWWILSTINAAEADFWDGWSYIDELEAVARGCWDSGLADWQLPDCNACGRAIVNYVYGVN